jgi:NTP pyrophosphatase (non-canonical NTP hydrolase)
MLPSTARRLRETPLAQWPCAGAPLVDGFYIYAHDENSGVGPDRIPDDLWRPIDYARTQGFDYVHFDDEAEPIDALPVPYEPDATASPDAPNPASGKLLNTDDLANKATVDHPDAYLNALLSYTRDLYGAMLKAGWKPTEIVDCMQHIERAARGLHAKALSPQPRLPQDAAALLADLRSVADFVTDEADNREEAGSFMSDYQNDAQDALIKLNGAIEQVRLLAATKPAGTGLRSARQAQVFNWCVAAFGEAHALSLRQRGLRLAEEAIEAAQACEVDLEQLINLVRFVYTRPVGDLAQELGGIGVTVLALAAAANLDADGEEAREVTRVLAKDLAHFHARNAAKNAAGFDADAYPAS